LTPLPLRRMAALAVVLGLVTLNSPLAVRYALGTISGQYLASTVLSVAVALSLSIAASVVTFEWAERRRLPLWRAGVLSLLPAIPILTLEYVVLWALAPAVPSWQFLDPTEPNTLSFQILVGLGDAMPLLVLLVGLLFLPAALQAGAARARELELVRREADLLRLRSHLEPHFVLNSLNAVAGLTTEDPEKARELLALLGDLFRDASGFSAYHSVADELAWLERYIAIHELRQPDVLSVQWQVDDAARRYRCPALLMQPLVENALMHGALRSRPGRLTVSARLEAGNVVFETRDNGPALGARRPGGKGVSIVERRLELEGAAAMAFSLHRDGAETVARVRLPLVLAEVTNG